MSALKMMHHKQKSPNNQILSNFFIMESNAKEKYATTKTPASRDHQQYMDEKDNSESIIAPTNLLISTHIIAAQPSNQPTGASSVGQDSRISLGGQEFRSPHLRMGVISLVLVGLVGLFLPLVGLLVGLGLQ